MRIEPDVGAIWPLIMLKQVVLPAPLGPMSASISPGSSENDTLLDREKAAIGFAEPLDAERRHRRALGRSAPTSPRGNSSTSATMSAPLTRRE